MYTHEIDVLTYKQELFVLAQVHENEISQMDNNGHTDWARRDARNRSSTGLPEA